MSLVRRFCSILIMPVLIIAFFCLDSLPVQAYPQAATDLSVPFVENKGQWDKNILFAAATPNGTVGVTSENTLIYAYETAGDGGMAFFQESFVAANAGAYPVGTQGSKAAVSYFKGSWADEWVVGARSYHSIELGEIYPLITAELFVRGKSVEKVFTVLPGGDPVNIKIQIEGGDLALKEAGELEIKGEGGSMYLTAPEAWQYVGGRKADVEIAYAIGSGGVYGFTVGSYDESLPLVIDPVFYGSYLGGGGEDIFIDMEISADGYVYALSRTQIPFSYTVGGYTSACIGGYDVSLIKMNAELTEVLAAAFIGGSANDIPAELAFDGDGNPLIVGKTASSDFPVTDGAFSKTLAGAVDAFLVKLAPGLDELIAAIYYGGDETVCWNYKEDSGEALAVGSDGTVYLAGSTGSKNLPMAGNGYDKTKATGNYEASVYSDAYIAAFSSNLTDLVAATYFGWSGGNTYGCDLLTDAAGYVYLGGRTRGNGSSFPITEGAYSLNIGTLYYYSLMYLSKFNSDLSALVASSAFNLRGADSVDLNYNFAGMTIDPGRNAIYYAYSIYYGPNHTSYLVCFSTDLAAGSTKYAEGNNFGFLDVRYNPEADQTFVAAVAHGSPTLPGYYCMENYFLKENSLVINKQNVALNSAAQNNKIYYVVAGLDPGLTVTPNDSLFWDSGTPLGHHYSYNQFNTSSAFLLTSQSYSSDFDNYVKNPVPLAFAGDGNVYMGLHFTTDALPTENEAYQSYLIDGYDGGILCLSPDLCKTVSADLTLRIDTVEVENGIVAQVQVANAGPDNAAGARVEFVVSPMEAVTEITVDAPEDDTVTVDGNTVTWIINSMITQVTSPSATLTINVGADFHGEITVSGTAAPVGATDPNPNNSAATAACDANPLADLLAGLTNTPLADGGWEHRIYVENLGPTGAKNVNIEYTLPGALTFVAASPEGYTYDEETGLISWTEAYLARNLLLEDTYLVTSGGYVPGMDLSGLVKISSGTPDPNPDNNETTVAFGGVYDCYLCAESSTLFYLNQFIPLAMVVNTGSTPFRPELTITLPTGIETVEGKEIWVYDAETNEVLGACSAAATGKYTWSGSTMLESKNGLRAQGEFRITEWKQEQNYDFSLCAELKGYDADGELQLVRSSTKEQTVARPDLGFKSHEITRVLPPEEQRQIKVVVETTVSDTYVFNTRGRAKVTMEIAGLSEKISVVSVAEAVNDGDPPPEQVSDNKWEWLLPQALNRTRDEKNVLLQVGPFAKGEGTEDVTISLQVSYEPGEFDYSAHELNTANDTGTILLHLRQNAVPEASLLTRASFRYDESTKNVHQTYTTSYAFIYADKIKRFVIEENYNYLHSLSGFSMMGRPELIEGIAGTKVNYSPSPGATPCAKGTYAAKIETPAGKFRFGEDLILNTRMMIEYEAYDGSTSTVYQYFEHTFRVEAPPPKIVTPVSGEMLDINNAFPVTGWALPNHPIRLLRAGDEQLLATALTDENGAFFITVPAGMASDNSISFYAVVVTPYSWAVSAPSKTVTLSESGRDWCPQRSVWSGSDTKGNNYSYSFRSASNGLPSTNGWEVPGVYGFWDTTLKIYTCPDPTEVWVIADNVKYEPAGRDGRYYIFHLGQAHDVIIHVSCEESEKPVESGGVVLIDPDGFVYKVTEGLNNVVPGAKVTCMEYDPATDSWGSWPAHLDIYENQVNPQIVGEDGYFAFFTPPGRYYIQVENPAPYQSWRSHDLFVITDIVHRNVPYTPLPAGSPAVTVYASPDGIFDENGLTLANVTVNQGEIVQWISDTAPDVTMEEMLDLTENPVIHIESLLDPETDNRGFDSGMLAPLAAYSYRFAASGDYEYYYKHGDNVNKGRVTVLAADAPSGGSQSDDDSSRPPAITAGWIGAGEMKVLEKTAQQTRLTIPDELLLAQIKAGQKKLEINLTEFDNTLALQFSSGQLALLSGRFTEIKLLTGYGHLTIPSGVLPQGEELTLTLGLLSQEAELPEGTRNLTEPAEFTATKPLLGPALLRLSYDTSEAGALEDIFLFASTSPWKPLSISAQDGIFAMGITGSVKYLLAAVKTDFTDIDDHWARRDILNLSLQGLAAGVAKDKFDPDREITRAEFAALLVKTLGLQSGTGENPFGDVEENDWFYQAVLTAYEKGLTSGCGAGRFGPRDKITREQAAAMLVRAMGLLGINTELQAGEAETVLAAFCDLAHISPWAKSSLAVCVKTGLLAGKGNNELAPAADTTRAEMVVLIRRLLDMG